MHIKQWECIWLSLFICLFPIQLTDYPSRSPTPALSYSNAVLSSLPPSISPLGEEEQSGSTSDSQSSVINLSEAGDFSSRNHNNSGSYPQQQGGRNMDFSPSPSPQPSTAVWSPSGQFENKMNWFCVWPPPNSISTSSTRNTCIENLLWSIKRHHFADCLNWFEN